jgi:hypothetical protein
MVSVSSADPPEGMGSSFGLTNSTFFILQMTRPHYPQLKWASQYMGLRMLPSMLRI